MFKHFLLSTSDLWNDH